MAYTTQQLVDIYTRANAGAAPSAATRLTLDAYAQQTQPGGGLSEQAALNQTLTLVNNTTAVAFATYQFFNGAAPSAAGIEFLLNSSTNANDLNDATGVYGSFNQESRFINFSINLALGGTNAAAFATAYGTGVTVRDTVASAYDKIIGNSVAAAAGNDVTAAVNWFSRQANVDALTSFVKANNPTFTAAQIDLAVKAAVIGQILSTAVTTGLGIYAGATRAAVTDLSDDGALTGNTATGLNIIAAYPGTGGGVVGKTFAFTGDIDTLVGTGNDDTFTGSVGGVTDTVTALDTVDGGAGVDTLILSDATGAALNTAALAVKNVEIVNLTSVTGLQGGALNTTGWTGLTTANVTLGAPAAAQAITVGAGTAASLTAGNVGANNLSVDGGTAVTVKTTAQTTGTIAVGGTTAPTGAVSVSTSGAYADGANVTLGAITVKGGSTVSVTQVTGITAAQTEAAKADLTNFTLTQSAVTVTGTAATKSVTVTQAAAVAEVDSTGTNGKIGVATGAVTITDVNSAEATKAGSITTVTLANGVQAVSSNALTTLNLSGTNAVTVNLSTTNTTTSKALTINAAGGTSTVNDAADVLTSATVNSSVDGSTVQVSGDSIATLSLGGTKSLTLTAGGALTGLKTVNVAGSGIVTANLSATGVTKVDTTGSTGSSIVTLNGTTAKIAYNGGAGADTVTINGTLDVDASIKLGAGNDRLLAGTTPVINASAATVIDGGDGIDAISSSLITVGNAAMFKNFEVINLSNTAGATFDIALLTGSTVQSLELNGGTGVGNYASVTTAQALNVTGAAAASDATLGFTGVTGTADAYTISFNALTTGTTASPTTVDAGIVRFAGIETVNVVSGSAGGVNKNVIALNDADARSLVVTGSQAAEISFNTAFGTAGANGLNSIDASAASGGVKVSTANAGIATAGLTIKGGAGADTIVVTDLGATATITVTTGGGKDTVDVGANVGIIGSGATAAVHTTVTDFGSGDSLALKNQGTEAFTATKVDVSGFSSLATILDSLAAGDGSTNGIIQWFQYGGNTYVVQDNTAGATFAATDVAVKLTGLVDLSTATQAGHVLTLA